MQTMVERGCGLDVHQATVVACLLIVLKNGRVQRQVRTFGTTTRELMGLRKWLLSESCTHVAMESTGVYWKPIYAILEGAFEIVVANAQHVKKVPGRKTDVKDAEWIADLLCHGLLRPSFVPPSPIRELRDLTRYRRKLVESRTAERNRLLKLLETANFIAGLSGLGNVLAHRYRLDFDITRQTDPYYLAIIFPGQFQPPMVVIAIRVFPIERHRPTGNFDVVNGEVLG